MTDKVQKIREEVVRMHNLLPVTDGDNISVNYADRICTTLEMYIDSLQEEPANDDLTNEIKLWFKQWSENEEEWSREDIWDTAEHFANWQKEQMMAKAIDACVTDIRTYKEENEVDFTVMYEKGIIPYEIEQEVKLIIVKED